MLGFTSGLLRWWVLGLSNLETTVGGSGFPLCTFFVNAYFRASRLYITWATLELRSRHRIS